MCYHLFVVTAVQTSCQICAKVETTVSYRSTFDSCFYRTNAHRHHEFHSKYQEESGALERQWSANWSVVTSVHTSMGFCWITAARKAMAAPAPAAFSTQQRQKSLTSTGPHVQAVSLTSQQVLQRLRSWCLSSNITTNLQAKTNSWFNYKSLSWGVTEEWDDMKLSWNSRCSLSRLRDTGIVGPWAKQGDEDTRPHWKEELAHTSEAWGKYTADLKCFG